jgi:hypothetical protein
MRKTSAILEGLNNKIDVINEAKVPTKIMKFFEEIIVKHCPGVDTLKTRNNSSDFPEVSVWSLLEALQRVYATGFVVGEHDESYLDRHIKLNLKSGRMYKDAAYVNVAVNPKVVSDIEKLVNKRFDNITTLKTRSSDSLDFHEVSVWGLKDVIQDVYYLGVKDGKSQGTPKVLTKGALGKIKY